MKEKLHKFIADNNIISIATESFWNAFNYLKKEKPDYVSSLVKLPVTVSVRCVAFTIMCEMLDECTVKIVFDVCSNNAENSNALMGYKVFFDYDTLEIVDDWFIEF